MKVFIKKFFVILLLISIPLSLIADSKKASKEELTQMVAPIALYPDALLSQILMASTYPDQVDEAVKWSKNNKKIKGDDAVKKVADKNWDASVSSLVAFPQVLEMMGKESDWVEDLGNAFLSQPDDIMDTIQSLRKKAKDEGNLKSSKEQKVQEKEESGEKIIIIEQTQPEIIYVPVYNPTIVYGPYPYPAYPPYYYYPPYYNPMPGFIIGFTIGIITHNSMYGGFHWHRRDIRIDVDRHNSININNKININSKNASWKDDVRPNNPRASKDIRDRKKIKNKRDLQRKNAEKSMNQKGIDLKKERNNLNKNSAKINRNISKVKDVSRDNRVKNIAKPNSISKSRNISRPNNISKSRNISRPTGFKNKNISKSRLSR